MEFVITVAKRSGIAKWTVVAQTRDLGVAFTVISSLMNNRLIEDDENDEILDAEFLAGAPQFLADLTAQIRNEAASSLPVLEELFDRDSGLNLEATDGEQT